MEFQKIASSARRRVTQTVDGIVRFAKLERVLAVVCIFIPALLIGFDHWTVRASISAYFDMAQDQVFYFPLSVASMLFVVNGVVKEKHLYNTYLGTMLAGVILFNCRDMPLLHMLFAIAFFGGNGIVILAFSSRKERWFKAIMVALIILSMLGCFVFHLFSLFWAEWISFGIIALHYFLESLGTID